MRGASSQSVCASVLLVTFISLFCCPAVLAESRLEKLQAEYRALYSKVSPSIVAVAREPYEELESRGGQAVLMSQAAAISGFVVEGGYVITYAESFSMGVGPGSDPRAVLDGLKELYAITADGKSHKCSVVGHDIRNLLLVLKLPADVKLPALKLGDSRLAKIGSTVAAFGNSFDCFIVDHQPSFAVGSLADFYRFELDDLHDEADEFGDPYRGNVFEVESTVNPGDYGGPLVNLDGEVIGMLTAHYHPGRQLGTAVPSSQFCMSFDALVSKKLLSKPNIGFWIKNMKKGKQRDPSITRIDSGSAAEAAGLKAGDVVMMVDGYAVDNRTELHDILSMDYETFESEQTGGDVEPPVTVKRIKSYGLPPGAVMTFTVRRGEQLLSIALTVGVRKESAPEEKTEPTDPKEGGE
ncbi:MAG: serine protease [Planctomycetaceae bacterium]|nr:serine protease [Planctomycetaceae bacterium]